MKATWLTLLALVGPTATLPTLAQSPPATPIRSVTDTYFGRAVVDNYRWLEDTNSPETQACLKAQGDYTAATVARLPGRDQLIKAFEDYDRLRTVRYGEVKKRGGRYFYRKTLPAEKVGKLYVRESQTDPENLLFDPAAYDPASGSRASLPPRCKPPAPRASPCCCKSTTTMATSRKTRKWLFATSPTCMPLPCGKLGTLIFSPLRRP